VLGKRTRATGDIRSLQFYTGLDYLTDMINMHRHGFRALRKKAFYSSLLQRDYFSMHCLAYRKYEVNIIQRRVKRLTQIKWLLKTSLVISLDRS